MYRGVLRLITSPPIRLVVVYPGKEVGHIKIKKARRQSLNTQGLHRQGKQKSSRDYARKLAIRGLLKLRLSGKIVHDRRRDQMFPKK